MRKVIKNVVIILFSILAIFIVVGIFLFWNEINSLLSLKQVDDYGML